MESSLPDRIGSYRVLGLLGQGGMGCVYEAVHGDSGRRVALKSVKLPRESLLPRIRREIQALARIRHPGVVHIYDSGTHEGLPWYAMELVEGTTLRRWADRLGAEAETAGLASEPPGASGAASAVLTWTEASLQVEAGEPAEAGDPGAPTPKPEAWGLEPDRLQRILGLVRRLCTPLAYLHGEGIVHRDLKPDNVIVRADGQPVLVDFGVMTRFGGGIAREALVVEVGAAGTLRYMAPEQLRGELVDARADLYSLGCILHELLTGAPPFEASSTPEMIRSHLFRSPAPPSSKTPGLVPELDELVLGLLAKDPRERLGHAADVAARLAELGGEDPGASAGPRPRAYLYRPGFAGRAEAMEQIERHLQRLEDGSGSVLLVSGESGVGKTRLVLEAGRCAEARDVRVLAGECLPASASEGRSGGAPLEALRRPLQAIADRCRERGREETDRLLGPRGKVLALYEPALCGLPGQDAYPEPGELPADAARSRLFQHLVETFTALTAAGSGRIEPYVLILDDLQWNDELTAEFLEFLLHSGSLERLPLAVIGTYRSEEVGPNLQRLVEAEGLKLLHLGRLDEPAIASMVSDMLALTPPPEVFVHFLARHSEGNPFFVAEYLRTAVAENLLYRDEAGRWKVTSPDAEATRETYEALPLPLALRDLVSRRLSGLSPLAHGLVEAAAVLGRELDGAVLAQVAGLDEEELLRTARELLARQVLEEHGDAGFRFVHDKIREVAYAGIAAERREALHRSAAQAIEAAFGAERYEHLAALGLHRERGGQPLQAAHAWVLAGERAAASSAAQEGLDALDRAIRVLEATGPETSHDAELIRAFDARARLRDQLGRFAEAEADAIRMAELARTAEDPLHLGRALRHRARALDNTGQYDEAIRRYEEALGILEGQGYPEDLCEIRSLLGWIHAVRGSYREAERQFRLALGTSDLPFQSAARRQARMVQGLTLYRRGRPREAFTIFESLLLEYERVADPLNRARCKGMLGAIERDFGHLDRARELFNDARETFHRLRAVQDEILLSNNMGSLLFECGLVGEAARVLEETCRAAIRAGESSLGALASLNLSRCELVRGRIAAAIEQARDAAQRFQKLGDRHWWSHSLVVAGSAWAAAAHPDESERCFGQAIELAGTLHPSVLAQHYTSWAASLLDQEGGWPRAREPATQALGLLSTEAPRALILRAQLVHDLLDLREASASAPDTSWQAFWSHMLECEELGSDLMGLQRAALAGAEIALEQSRSVWVSQLLGLYRRKAFAEHAVHELRALAIGIRQASKAGERAQLQVLRSQAEQRLDNLLASLPQDTRELTLRSPLIRFLMDFRRSRSQGPDPGSDKEARPNSSRA